MRHDKIVWRVLLYAAAAGLATAAGCSQSPISSEEAENLRVEIKVIREQLTQVETELADVTKSIDDKDMEEQVHDLRNKLDLMAKSLSDVEETLKPKEPPRSAGQAPPGGATPGGAAPGSPGGARTY